MYRGIVKNYVAWKLLGERCVAHPVLASLYLTHRCNLRCVYCSDGSGAPFPDRPVHELNAHGMCRVIDRIARSVGVLDMTGGEPLLRGDIRLLIAYARRAGIRKIVLNTNGLLLDEHLDLLGEVDTLYVSVDSLSAGRLGRIAGAGEEDARRILRNVEAVAGLGKRGRIVLSAVLLPDNLDEIPAILDYCRSRGFGFAASPALLGTAAVPALREAEAYRRCVDAILEAKWRGLHVVGTRAYYDVIRDFRRFRCYPLLMPTIDPCGRVYFPCLEKGIKPVNVLDHRSLGDALRAAANGRPYPPECGNVCHILCHAGLSVLFDGKTPTKAAPESGEALRA